MRYTGSANNFLWYLFMPFLVIFYIGFIFWSDHNYSNNSIKEVINNKQQAVNSLMSIDGIILGGSNAQFGISATSLNTLTNLTWMNLGIPAEGFSDINYANFISNSLSDAKRLDVSLVVYSSTTLVSKSVRKETSMDTVGKKKISFKPQRSLASYMKSFLGYNNENEFTLANKYGDLDFSEFDCGIFISDPLISRNYLNEVELRMWASEQFKRISELFPNAKIVITVPNGFNKNIKEPNNDERSYLIRVLKDVSLKQKFSGKNSIHIISQKPYPSSNLMCGDNWHPNEEGREWRTNELYKLINDQL